MGDMGQVHFICASDSGICTSDSGICSSDSGICASDSGICSSDNFVYLNICQNVFFMIYMCLFLKSLCILRVE